MTVIYRQNGAYYKSKQEIGSLLWPISQPQIVLDPRARISESDLDPRQHDLESSGEEQRWRRQRRWRRRRSIPDPPAAATAVTNPIWWWAAGCHL